MQSHIYKMEAEREIRQKRRKQCHHISRNKSDVAISRMLADYRSCKRQGIDFPIEPPKQAQPWQHPDFIPMKLISDLASKTMREQIWLL